MKEPSLAIAFPEQMTEIQVSYKNKTPYKDRVKISCSKDCAAYFRQIWTDKLEYVEEFRILCLNRANKILGWATISSGGMSGTVADPKVIFQIALKSCASSIILGHNHPSGNLQPSESDIRLTKKLKNAGVSLDLPVLDHIILTSESYYSFADEGIL
jgi:DNA repair protein RadC